VRDDASSKYTQEYMYNIEISMHIYSARAKKTSRIYTEQVSIHWIFILVENMGGIIIKRWARHTPI